MTVGSKDVTLNTVNTVHTQQSNTNNTEQQTVANSQAINNRTVTDVTNQTDSQSSRNTQDEGSNQLKDFLVQLKTSWQSTWDGITQRFENSKLFHSMQGFAKGISGNATMATSTALALIEKGVSLNEENENYDPVTAAFDAQTCAGVMMSYPSESCRLSAQVLLQESEKDSFLIKCLAKHMEKEFSSENLDFIRTAQKHFIVDVNAPLTIDPNLVEFKVADLEPTFQKFVLTSSPNEINLSNSQRKNLCSSHNDYIEALKDLDFASRTLANAAIDENNDEQAATNTVTRIGGPALPVGNQTSSLPSLSGADIAQLDALDTEIDDNLGLNDPLYAEKKAVLDAKESLHFDLREALLEMTRLTQSANGRMTTLMQNKVEGTPFEAVVKQHHQETAAARLAQNQQAQANNSVQANNPVQGNTVQHTNTFSMSTLSLASLRMPSADTISPANSLTFDALTTPQNNTAEKPAVSQNVLSEPQAMARTTSYGTHLSVADATSNDRM